VLLKKLIKEQNISEQLRNEMTVHKKLQHPNIIGYYDQFSTNDDIFIILELCKSETLEMLCENYMKLFKRNISVRLVQHFLKQIINAVYYMHSKGVIHRDLKLENIMFKFSKEEVIETNNKSGFFYYNEKYVKSWESFEEILLTSEIKIIDLGFAKQLDKTGFTTSFLGTPAFVAPEILRKKTVEKTNDFKYTSKVDTWSIGVIAFNLITGRFPFELSSKINTFTDLYFLHKEGKYYFEDDIHISLELLDFINGMLQFSESKRFACTELEQHPFIKTPIEDQKMVYIKQLNKETRHFELNSNDRKEFINNFDSFTSFREEDSLFDSEIFTKRIEEFIQNDEEIDKIFNIYTRINLLEDYKNGYVIISLNSEEIDK